MNMDEYYVTRKSKKPRKIMTITPTKYEASEMLNANKKYWNQVFDEIDTSARVPTKETESKHLSKVLPSDLYEKVCNTLDMPIITTETIETKKVSGKAPRRLVKEPLLSYRKSLFIDRELDSDTDVEMSDSDDDDKQKMYREFLKKPEREQVTWASHWLRPEREDEKSLVRKADDLTDRIAQEFCEYMKQLGGDQQSQLFTPKAIKELFQIEFDTHVARSLQVVPKELPCIADKIAFVTGNPELSRHAFLEREVLRDMKAENRPDRLRAFSHSLPLQEQWRAPQNDTRTMWRSARRVPKDLVTLKTVWEGITNLRSVKEYCRWMIAHPEYRRAPYLASMGMFDPAVLDARNIFEMNNVTTPPLAHDDAPAPIDHIRRRLSELAGV